jgi:predicted transcriptional regulator
LENRPTDPKDISIDWTSVLCQVEDVLFPKLGLSVWERAVFYHLLRRTWVLGQEKTRCSIIEVASGVGISDTKAREVLRSLHEKGCVKIVTGPRAATRSASFCRRS